MNEISVALLISTIVFAGLWASKKVDFDDLSEDMQDMMKLRKENIVLHRKLSRMMLDRGEMSKRVPRRRKVGSGANE